MYCPIVEEDIGKGMEEEVTHIMEVGVAVHPNSSPSQAPTFAEQGYTRLGYASSYLRWRFARFAFAPHDPIFGS